MLSVPYRPFLLLVPALLLGACAQSLRKPEQGIAGTFLAYGPPRDTIACEPLKTQPERDECRRANSRVVEEPHRASIAIRNLQTREVRRTDLDAQGSYKVLLDPGEYEVCVRGEMECSDPLTVKVGDWVTYGQRLPREADSAAAPAATVPGK